MQSNHDLQDRQVPFHEFKSSFHYGKGRVLRIQILLVEVQKEISSVPFPFINSPIKPKLKTTDLLEEQAMAVAWAYFPNCI